MRRLQALPIDTVESALPQLAALLDGTAPAWLPVPARDPRESARLTAAMAVDSPIDERAALVVATSGSTGTPKGAMLTRENLAASAAGTAERLGGPGQWLLAMPPHHVAGVQVMLRSLAAGWAPVGLDVSAGFAPSSLADGFAAMTAPRRYVSLVPTQLVKILADPAATQALARFDGVLIGGGACPPPVREAALAAGIRMVRTYGMSETAGGCVYDGVPLPGVEIRLDGPDGRIVLGGPTVALGYRNAPAHPAFSEPGWFRTDDAGTMTDGELSVTGRLDEAISTGGLTVLPQVVEAVLARVPGVAEVAVFAQPDPRLGQRVAAAVVPVAGQAVTVELLRAAVEAELDRTAAPRALFLVDELPRRGPGKVDRRALVEQYFEY
ncbi:AMP-dependent synthetase and ligase OS=Tsukamurella paurometabola (strain ATCC 8368 / DSM /CCUG 35730 / CIP 100753 / JCM 10117 / KCTC 9821 / NBRC 16120/ NCIMB 702349 / NCTC 13040) OX=521096 GN=Tpau_0704 PE=3 SV=1 [Tsukamurella paurometabola]|uniref:AMP-dependent synthetase and ligase n=1 Tax=Tsukamurella paurometabola (strain ATCC 8368 / DSM 20162 / CCUG 35730 / CIP 100753 / JCM 10117 / KCTC 9821 / NBRC 16120 / NCIMB 702349 / NCTC 13040) TaxID=521096 RepID=D5UT54_TSUPD|nr:o-succinylbenzoate--CoA ligase [Tsukamurella paurometabola]ADG77341.1 AMP-dependent synthetase and ligase [Tsukamurella paurometabola DSM 20162]SUP43540.1 2-succinylbenzoate--CoA ligase [Tsukamurella paurometabola]